MKYVRRKEKRRGRFKTIHGEIIERDIGIAGVKHSGQEAIVEMVFATDGGRPGPRRHDS